MKIFNFLNLLITIKYNISLYIMSVELENKLVLGAIFVGSLAAGASIIGGYYILNALILLI